MINNNKTDTAILYARFSPRRNADDCESCRTQFAYCRQYCESNALRVIGTYQDDALSGATMRNRAGLQDALQRACREQSALVVYSLSRLARNTRESIDISEQLDKYGADLICVRDNIDTTKAMGRFVFTIMAAIAELEREVIAERTSEAMLMHQKNGLKMGGKLPYGYTEDKSRPGYIKKHPREQKVIKLICRLRKKGYPYNKIARKLQKHGITTGRKTPKKDKKRRVITDIDGNPVEYIESTWKHQQIKKILHREGLS